MVGRAPGRLPRDRRNLRPEKTSAFEDTAEFEHTTVLGEAEGCVAPARVTSLHLQAPRYAFAPCQ